MRFLASTLFATIAFSAAAAACGGSSPPPASNPSAGTAGAAASSSAAAADAGPTTTTTATLGAGGDLSGAKLTTASSSTVQTTQTTDTNAPVPGPHAQEVGRSVQDIRTLVMSHRDEARKCYDDNLKMYPGVEGDLDVKFTIDPKGVVSDAAVNDEKSSIHATGIGSCVVDVIKKIHFSESEKGFETRAHYPFNFHPKGSNKAPSSPPPSN